MLNLANRTLFTGDNLDVMRGINSACIDLIYLDPPFNSSADYAAPIGSKAVIADENANKDRIKNIDFRLNIAGETDDDGVILVDPRNYNATKKQHITRLKFSVPIAFK